MDETVELEREIVAVLVVVVRETMRPVFSACGHGVVQMVLEWLQA
jgi:hypothetical protein